MNENLRGKLLFIINKIENNTLYVSQVLQDQQKNLTNSDIFDHQQSNLYNNSDLTHFNKTLDHSSYDSAGAAKYIIVVIFVYGFAIVFFIASQVKSSKKFIDDVDGVNAEKLLRTMETDIFTKEVLAKLSDETLRQKAWQIYHSSPKTSNNSDNSSFNYDDNQGEKRETNENWKINDKQSMSDIEKRLKLINKSFMKNGINADTDLINEVNTLQSNKTPKMKNNSSTKQISNNPLIVLQTDHDSLLKLTEMSKSNTNTSINNQEFFFDTCELSEKVTCV